MVKLAKMRQHAVQQAQFNPKATFPLPMRSTRPPRSPKFSNQARLIQLYKTCSWPSPLEYGRLMIGYWSSRGSVDRVLIGKRKRNFYHTWSFPDQLDL